MHRRISRPSIAAAVLLLTIPVSGATWMVHGSYEPDTPYDVPTLMWQDAPGALKHRVYFGVVSYVDDVDVSPNVGALQTQVEVPGNERHVAALGVWVDCNGDGYIGMVETAAREYRNELLADKTLCPPVTGSIHKWTEGAHNYNGWVTELIPIARQPTPRDVRVYRDDDARVWGDYHRPDERPTHRSCALNPQPRGTYQSTGGLLNFVDCRADILGAFNTAADAVGDPLGLRFADPDDARTGPLGQVETFGSEDTQHSAAHVADCSQPYIVRVGDKLNESGLGPATGDETGGGTLHNIAVYPVPANPVGNTQDPTVPGTYNETREAFLDDCDTSNDRGADFYGGLLGEDDFNGVDPNNKREADWNFGFATSNRGGFPVSLLPGSAGSAGANENDLGVGLGGSRWIADSTWLTKPGPSTVKADLSGDTPQAGIAPAYWLSFYAYVSSTTTARGLALPGGTGTYGSWHCGGQTSGIHNGWNCDPDAWYVNPDGTLIQDPDGELVRPGQVYNLRDVDCYDGGIGSTGVAILPAAYGDSPCP